jgi:hypothetical protein
MIKMIIFKVVLTTFEASIIKALWVTTAAAKIDLSLCNYHVQAQPS